MTPRCKHGFIRGLCRVPLCVSWDGVVKEPHVYRSVCESCGGPMLKGNQGARTGWCQPCRDRVADASTRREAQEAWLYGAPRWS